jgi:NlpC/P60 family putative phage cell wall peptidase
MPERDPEEIARLRAAIVAEAESWIGTTFHHRAWVKGAGADCLGLIYGVYRAVGLIDDIKIPFYRPDFMHHRDEETYLGGLLEHGHRVERPEAGDVAMFKYGRVFGHAGIVVDWPHLIHAFAERGRVCPGEADQGRLRRRKVVFLSIF